MGQRHQIFLKVHNPYKNDRLYLEGEDKKKAGKIFGRGKFTVIALHHQWLYGRSALGMASHILNVTNQEHVNEYNSPFGERYYGGRSIGKTPLEAYIDAVMMMLQTITDPKFPRGTGIEGMHFLNTECLDDNGTYNDRWDMRKYFDCGDNNDGITIIDTIEQKYCFMNIYDQEKDYHSASSLPKLKPATAKEYVEAYYGVTKKTVNPYYIENLKEGETIEGVLEGFKKDNQEFIDMLKDKQVLTIKEIVKMFPEMKEKLLIKKVTVK